MAFLQIRPDLAIPRAELEALCRRRHITWLAVYGSALRDDFGPASDVDLLAEFSPGRTPSLFGMLDLEQEFSGLLAGRPVDLGTTRALNRWIKDRVLSEARVLCCRFHPESPTTPSSPCSCASGSSVSSPSGASSSLSATPGKSRPPQK